MTSGLSPRRKAGLATFVLRGRERVYRCLTYQRSTVSVCPFQDRVKCQQPGEGTTISEG